MGKGCRNSVIVIRIFKILTAAAMIAIVSSACVSNVIYAILSFVVEIITLPVMRKFVYFSETTHLTRGLVFMTIERIISIPLDEKAGFVSMYAILIAGTASIYRVHAARKT